MNAALPAGAPPPLVLATNNGGKLAEFRRILAGLPWTVLSLGEAGFTGELVEPGDTYAENSLAKAMAVSSALGVAALSDDSGIEVDALGGWPGPASARWLGGAATDDDRLSALLAEVRSHSPDDPRVRYVCVVCLSAPLAEPVLARGECLGTLVAPRGRRGCGYDPAFLSTDLGVTFGEAPQAAKDRVSHRARAVRRLVESNALSGLSHPG